MRIRRLICTYIYIYRININHVVAIFVFNNGTHVFTDVDPDEIFPLLPPEEAESRKNLNRLRNVVSQAYDEVDAKVISVELEKYVFPFENLVFEGGGNKGLAYCGAIRVSTIPF